MREGLYSPLPRFWLAVKSENPEERFLPIHGNILTAISVEAALRRLGVTRFQAIVVQRTLIMRD